MDLMPLPSDINKIELTIVYGMGSSLKCVFENRTTRELLNSAQQVLNNFSIALGKEEASKT